jgi:hypothetical protein
VSDLFLGIIALSVLVMAVIQVVGCVFLAKTARRVEQLTHRIEDDLRPIVRNLQAASVEVTRAAGLAAAHLHRSEQFLGSVSKQAESLVGMLIGSLAGGGRKGFALMTALKTLITLFRQAQRQPPRPQSAGMDEDEALFIG